MSLWFSSISTSLWMLRILLWFCNMAYAALASVSSGFTGPMRRRSALRRTSTTTTGGKFVYSWFDYFYVEAGEGWEGWECYYIFHWIEDAWECPSIQFLNKICIQYSALLWRVCRMRWDYHFMIRKWAKWGPSFTVGARESWEKRRKAEVARHGRNYPLWLN